MNSKVRVRVSWGYGWGHGRVMVRIELGLGLGCLDNVGNRSSRHHVLIAHVLPEGAVSIDDHFCHLNLGLGLGSGFREDFQLVVYIETESVFGQPPPQATISFFSPWKVSRAHVASSFYTTN